MFIILWLPKVTLNRIVSDCSSVLQTQMDLFQPEILPNLSENCQI